MELFAGDEIAKGYAAQRPAVHSAVVDEAFAQLGAASRRHRVLDVGCGAGASTRAATPWAQSIVGLDPEIQMIRNARTVGGRPHYIVGAAEAIPLGTDTGVLAAAGFSIGSGERMTVPIAMNADAYVAYLMTETNVAGAVQRGESAGRVRQWCDERFSPLLTEAPVIEFEAWWSIVTPTG